MSMAVVRWGDDQGLRDVPVAQPRRDELGDLDVRLEHAALVLVARRAGLRLGGRRLGQLQP
jgi:hypothetical protein